MISRKSNSQPEDDPEEEEEEELDPELDENQVNTNPNSQSSKKVVTPISPEVLSDSAIRVSEFPLVVRHKVVRPHASVVAVLGVERGNESCRQNCVSLENVSYGQLQVLSAMTKESLVESEKGEGSVVITPPKIMEGRGVVKRFGLGRFLVVPMHADWFSPGSVHRLERQVVPQYFSGKSAERTPEKYMECRNHIVGKYMENPDKRLAVSACDKLAVGADSDDMARIYRFLDHWGIINYCVPALNRETQNDGLCLNEDTSGELRVPINNLKSIDSLIQFDKPRCQLRAADVYSGSGSHVHGDSDLDDKIRERLSESRCNCCSRPLPIIYYQSQKEVDVLLCLECFHEGRFVAGHSSLDFTRFDSSKDYGDPDGVNWSDQETLLLLEAMEIYGENWNEIAERVKTKSKAQCILHFLRIPMDDSSMEDVDVPHNPSSVKLSNNDERDKSHLNSNGHLAGSSAQDPNFESRVPFSNYANPVMALVAFLASAVGPRVAAACAHASLAELAKDDPIAASGCINITNSSQLKEGIPLSDAKLRAASKAGLSAAATKAKLFADHEEREIQRLSANIINHQLKRLELKLKQFTEVETMLMKECEQVERVKQRIAAERAAFISAHFGSGGVARPTSLPAIGPAMTQNNTSNMRQQIIPDGQSQPYMGYTSSRPVHPHGSPMSQQQAYGLGPRMPLSAINPSSASPSSTIRTMSRPVSGARSALD
ncbi:hypothetical protein AgCh_026128 [Apium graveolens]